MLSGSRVCGRIQHLMTDTTPQRRASQACDEWQPLLMLSAAGGELEPAEQSPPWRARCSCASCAAALGNERELLALLSGQHSEPDAACSRAAV